MQHSVSEAEIKFQGSDKTYILCKDEFEIIWNITFIHIIFLPHSALFDRGGFILWLIHPPIHPSTHTSNPTNQVDLRFRFLSFINYKYKIKHLRLNIEDWGLKIKDSRWYDSWLMSLRFQEIKLWRKGFSEGKFKEKLWCGPAQPHLVLNFSKGRGGFGRQP